MKKLGFGTMRLPQLDPDDPKSIDEAQVCRMVDSFLDQGFTYFDTAYMYHEEMSERFVKKCLVDRHSRDSFVLADKMPLVVVKKQEDLSRFFTEQMEKTGTDYFDYYLLHNIGVERYPNVQLFDAFGFVEEQRRKGHIGKIGFSFHDGADCLDRVLTDHPEVDFVQLQVNYLDWDSAIIQSGRCVEVARKHGKDIMVMGPVKGGTLAQLPEEAEALIRTFAEAHPDLYNGAIPSAASFAVRFAASQENVRIVLSGMSNEAQLKDNTSYMKDFRPLNEDELKLVDSLKAVLNRSIAIPCTSCKYCMEVCPKNLNIPAYFGLYNMHATTGKMTNMYYERASLNHGKAVDCIKCGKCEHNCPQHIEIRTWLDRFADLYEKK